jgi:hypothetical protein
MATLVKGQAKKLAPDLTIGRFIGVFRFRFCGADALVVQENALAAA